MKSILIPIIAFLLASAPKALASETIFLPNLGTGLTGTDVSGKKSADVYVSGGVLTFSEGATAADGDSLPALLKIIGGYDGSNVRAIKTDTSGAVQVDVESSALPTGAATAANQSTANTSLSSIDTKLSSQATAANQSTANTSLSSIDTKLSSQATAANQSTANTTLSTISGKLPSALGQTTASGSLSVVMASDQSTPSGRAYVTSARNDYSGANVTTGAWVQLVASTSDTVNEVEIFDSSGRTLELGTGAAASETRQAIIFPGGNGRIPLKIASGTRVSVRAISATASSGELDINFYK